MRKIVFLFFLFSLLGLDLQGQDWEVFQSVDGKFSVLTPGAMKKKENAIETEIGQLKYITYIHQSTEKDADNLVYMISYCDYPEFSVHSDSVDFVPEFFATTVKTAVESVEGELVYSSDILLHDYPGILWRVNYNKGQASIKTRAFLVENRYYSIQVITLKDKSMNIFIDKYLDSFRLLDNW